MLLVAGCAIRPILILACELHAVAYQHTDDPHQHVHEAPGAQSVDATTPESGHGDHDQLALGDPGPAAPPVAYAVLALAAGKSAVPSARPAPLLECPRGVPFRPPIV